MLQPLEGGSEGICSELVLLWMILHLSGGEGEWLELPVQSLLFTRLQIQSGENFLSGESGVFSFQKSAPCSSCKYVLLTSREEAYILPPPSAISSLEQRLTRLSIASGSVCGTGHGLWYSTGLEDLRYIRKTTIIVGFRCLSSRKPTNGFCGALFHEICLIWSPEESGCAIQADRDMAVLKLVDQVRWC